jgi:hypothetical protein
MHEGGSEGVEIGITSGEPEIAYIVVYIRKV